MSDYKQKLTSFLYEYYDLNSISVLLVAVKFRASVSPLETVGSVLELPCVIWNSLSDPAEMKIEKGYSQVGWLLVW